MMSFLDTTAVKHYGGFLSYWAMIPSMYLGRASVKCVKPQQQYSSLALSVFLVCAAHHSKNVNLGQALCS